MKKLLFIITIFGFLLRFINVSNLPPALSWDEVSIGYNAYSILKTGRDEHGKFLPLDAFSAYGDYKPPLSIYLTVPTIALFGLNEFGVRFPVVLFSTLAIPLIYLLTEELFQTSSYITSKIPIINNQYTNNNKYKIINNQKKSNFGLFGYYLLKIVWLLDIGHWLFSEKIALLSAFFLSISPWHIQLSRAGFESTIAFTFILLGMVLILRTRTYPKVFLVSFIPFVCAMYTFNSARYAGPLIAFSYLIFIKNHILLSKKYIIGGLIVALVLVLPIIPHLLSKESRLRFKEVSIFNTQSVVEESNKRIQEDHNAWWSKILHNRRIGYTKLYAEHFLDNIRPDFLFTRGDGNPKFSTQETGQMYLLDASFLVIGYIVLIYTFPSIALLLFCIGVFAIAPAGFAVETPHALRTLNALPSFIIPIAFGMAYVIHKFYSFRYTVIALLIFGYIFSFSHFIHQYVVHFSTEYSGEWQYGYKQAIEYVMEHEKEYDSFVISESIGRPWMYIAFYSHYDPNAYRNDIIGGFDADGFFNVKRLGKWRISREGKLNFDGRTLYILDPKDVPDGANIKKIITLLNGEKKLVIFE